jgi:hypothetical protein
LQLAACSLQLAVPVRVLVHHVHHASCIIAHCAGPALRRLLCAADADRRRSATCHLRHFARCPRCPGAGAGRPFLAASGVRRGTWTVERRGAQRREEAVGAGGGLWACLAPCGARRQRCGQVHQEPSARAWGLGPGTRGRAPARARASCSMCNQRLSASCSISVLFNQRLSRGSSHAA